MPDADSAFLLHRDGRTCRRLWDQYGVRAWMMNSFLIQSVGEAGKWDIRVATNVMQPLLRMLSLRRTIKTPLTLPTGETVYPALELSPMTVLTEEVKFSIMRKVL